MQLLYVTETMENTPKQEPVKTLRNQFDKTEELFIYLINIVAQVAKYAETDARNRGNKNMPTAADLNVNIKIAGNILLWQILENENYKLSLDKFKPQVDKDELIRSIYNELTETDEYKNYIAQESRQPAEEKAIMNFIFNELVLPNENVDVMLEEQFTNWQDDAEMLQQLVNSFLQKPSSYKPEKFLDEEKWKYARNLFTTVIEKKEHLLEYIVPKLKNWEADRIALLDMLILRMGIAELLYFETIPPKVTINEYIDIAKEYSTQQSGQFVNGILDNVRKQLITENKLNKTDFKPVKR